MSRERVDMDRLRELVRLHRKGLPVRNIATMLVMGPSTERKYRLGLQAPHGSLPDPLGSAPQPLRSDARRCPRARTRLRSPRGPAQDSNHPNRG